MDLCGTESFRDCIAWWAEPLSWLATIVALAVGLPQLFYIVREQRRISNSLRRRPRLLTLLGTSNADENYGSQLMIQPNWENGHVHHIRDLEGEAYEQPENKVWVAAATSLVFITKNVGELSALDVSLTYAFPESLRIDYQDTDLGNYHRVGVNQLLESAAGFALNPQQSRSLEVGAYMPEGLKQFEIKVKTTLRDAVDEDTLLTVHVKQRDAKEPQQ